MKKVCLPVLISAIALTGCSHHYVLKLNNGAQVSTATKPKLQEGSWRFKDAKGEEQYVPAGSVREIAPASAVSSESKPQPVQGPPKKRHWYFLWLA
jgi:hypothetical protein